MNEINSQDYCKLCNKEKHKYKCPKCEILYCSITCYKTHNSACTEEFYQKNIEEKMKADKITSPEEIQKMKEILLKSHQDKDKQMEDIEKNENLISKDRANFLMKLIEKDMLTDLSQLTLEEQKLFGNFVKDQKQLNQEEEVIPWWEIKSSAKPTNIDIQELDHESQQELVIRNLNEFNLYSKSFSNEASSQTFEQTEDIIDSEASQQAKQNKKDDDEDYDDLEVIDLNQEEKVHEDLVQKYRIILKSYSQIPSIQHLLKTKEPSPTEVQWRAAQIRGFRIVMRSHARLAFVSVFSGSCYRHRISIFLVTKNNNSQDPEHITLPKSHDHYLIEGFLRFYDLLHRYESDLRDELEDLTQSQYARQIDKERKSIIKRSLKQIGLGKQKLIFFKSFIKSKYSEAFDEELIREINGFQEAFVQDKIFEKKVYQEVKKLKK
eukprot:403366072